MLRRIVVNSLLVAIALLLALASAWGALALWFRLPAPEFARGLAACLFGLFGLWVIFASFTRMRLRAYVAFLVSFTAVLVWWNTIKPPAEGEWAPDVARQVTGTLDGDQLTLTNVRDFEWRSNADFTERWQTRTYDLDSLRTADLFMSYWGSPNMAHVILSFGFDGGQYLAWSVEVRRQVGGAFSPVADLFKSSPLVIVAADERDVVGVRSNVRGEDVQLYRLKASPEVAKALLLEYMIDANELAKAPQFYNSITTNCTTTVVKMMRAVGDIVPFDWRLIVNGYLPEYAYDRGALDTRLPLAELKALAHIDERAKSAGLMDFSRVIRTGVPSPNLPMVQQAAGR
ncbi:DUF4105 domain-containing protein [Rhizobiaceae bacterium n13]|uniref:DUF4105 domain-containing protein n=1 Tax=Ferirhizobium litorale TaxID=2927786 RepID=A0AAE3U3H3_9HYPH|nr:DUF4105 domain-containing protein [Fererhizobium litorale]MDI7864430.1 DUF4105 domain-containing protein [Fererhizobium litorale]MDI7924656.1 DUF4105 domain-containing protein [Fererhizobium litorale]